MGNVNVYCYYRESSRDKYDYVMQVGSKIYTCNLEEGCNNVIEKSLEVLTDVFKIYYTLHCNRIEEVQRKIVASKMLTVSVGLYSHDIAKAKMLKEVMSTGTYKISNRKKEELAIRQSMAREHNALIDIVSMVKNTYHVVPTEVTNIKNAKLLKIEDIAVLKKDIAEFMSNKAKKKNKVETVDKVEEDFKNQVDTVKNINKHVVYEYFSKYIKLDGKNFFKHAVISEDLKIELLETTENKLSKNYTDKVNSLIHLIQRIVADNKDNPLKEVVIYTNLLNINKNIEYGNYCKKYIAYLVSALEMAKTDGFTITLVEEDYGVNFHHSIMFNRIQEMIKL